MVEDQPEGNGGFENLKRLMQEMDARNSQPFVVTPEFVQRRLDAMIVQLTTLLRLEHEAQAGVIPTAASLDRAAPGQQSPAPSGSAQMTHANAHWRMFGMDLKRRIVTLLRRTLATIVAKPRRG